MPGRIEAESRTDKGTTFVLTLKEEVTGSDNPKFRKQFLIIQRDWKNLLLRLQVVHV